MSVDANMQAEQPEYLDQAKQSLEDEKRKAEGYLASWQRSQADFVNLKRRAEQERSEAGKAANAALLLALLPVIDDMERAFAAIPPELEKQGWVSGMKLIWRKFQTTLQSQGLSQVECIGERFDPCLHEAVRRCSGKEGMIVQEVEKGYRFHDKLIRPSKVSVGAGEEDNEEE